MALQLKREKFLEHFANRSSCLIGMEACGGSQHWARSRWVGHLFCLETQGSILSRLRRAQSLWNGTVALHYSRE